MKQVISIAERKPWERQKENGRWESLEAFQAFQAFQVYLSIGASRSLSEVGLKIYPPGKKGRSRTPGRISRWSRQWNWVDRASAWDEYTTKSARTERRGEIEKMQKRHAQQAAAATAALSAPIRELVRRINSNEAELTNFSLRDLMTLSALASRNLAKMQEAERIARLGGDGQLPAEEAEDRTVPITKVQWIDPEDLEEADLSKTA